MEQSFKFIGFIYSTIFLYSKQTKSSVTALHCCDSQPFRAPDFNNNTWTGAIISLASFIHRIRSFLWRFLPPKAWLSALPCISRCFVGICPAQWRNPSSYSNPKAAHAIDRTSDGTVWSHRMLSSDCWPNLGNAACAAIKMRHPRWKTLAHRPIASTPGSLLA